LIIACQVMAMALWFSVTAVMPALKTEGGLDDFTAGLFTSAVQAGFVLGTLCAALFSIADRFDPRQVFLVSAEVGTLTNLAFWRLIPPDRQRSPCAWSPGFGWSKSTRSR